MATKPGSKSSISDHQPSIFRKRFRVQTPAAETLPEEIIEEILLKLPVRSLLRFTCVSKSWRSLISSNNFIGAHLKVSRKDTNFTHHKIFATINCPDFSLGLKQCSLPRLFSGLEYNAVDVDCQIKNIISNALVVGSCNGLVCLLINSRDIYLLNPSTRNYKKLPDVDSKSTCMMIVKYGFGFDESSEDYKVLAAYYDESSYDESSFTVKMKMKIYSLRTDSWKRIEGFESSLLFENGLFEDGRLPSAEVKALKFVNGNLHWCKIRHVEPNFRWYIVSFDLGSEICQRVAPPDNVEDGYSISLGVIGGCLCVFHPETNNFDVWVMKEYGVSESWAKMVTVPRSSLPSSCLHYELVCIGPKGEIFFNFSGLKFVLYNPRDNRLRSPDMRDFTNYMEVLHYCESLVPLD